MFSRDFWSSLRFPWRRRRTARQEAARLGSFVKPGMLLLEDRIMPDGTPLSFTAPTNQPLAATLRVVSIPAGPQIELIANASQNVLAQQVLAATSQVTITGS